TRPSIMSDGATMSAPAAACDTAARTSCSTVGSLLTSLSTITPQWPWSVYSQRQTSVATTTSGDALLIARTAACTGAFGSYDADPMSSLCSGRPKSSTD